MEACCIVGKSISWILLIQNKERIDQIIRVQQLGVVVNHLGHIQRQFIKAKPFDAPAPDKAANEQVQALRCIPELCQILAQDDHYVGAHSLGIFDELQLVQAAPTRLVVARHDNLFLLHR